MKRILTAHSIPVCFAVFLKRLTFFFESEAYSGQVDVFWSTRRYSHTIFGFFFCKLAVNGSFDLTGLLQELPNEDVRYR